MRLDAIMMLQERAVCDTKANQRSTKRLLKLRGVMLGFSADLLPRRCRRAVVAVLYIATQADQTKPIRHGEIEARNNIERRALESVLQALRSAGVLNAKKGPRGGYLLGKEASAISVGEICSIALSVGIDSQPKHEDGSPLMRNIVFPRLASASAAYMMLLDQITIEELCAPAALAHGA